MVIKRKIDGKMTEIHLTNREMKMAYDIISMGDYINYVNTRLENTSFDNAALQLQTRDIVTDEFVEDVAAETKRRASKFGMSIEFAYGQAVRINMAAYLCSRLEKIRSLVPPGTRVRLIHMYDTFAPPDGTLGTVISVDDLCQIHVSWDSGGSLALIPGIDQFAILQKMHDNVEKEITSENEA